MSNEAQKTYIQTELGNLESRIIWSKRFAWWLVIGGGIAAGWGLWVFYHDSNGSSSLEKLSAVGSYFQGAIGSLWTLAGLMFIYVAFLGQKQQLLLQREEMEGQEEQFQLQQESIKRQNFESGFFQLLNMQNQIASGMRDSSGVKFEGRDCFRLWYGDFKLDFSDYLIRRLNKSLPHDPQNRELVIVYYEEFYESLQGDLGHYFRSLYHIIKFVKTSEVVTSYEDQRRYTSLVRAQLSAFELAFLFYNGISHFGMEKFKPLIEEFGLLENLDEKLLLHSSHENFYDPKAFK
jgi:hypothetical protein